MDPLAIKIARRFRAAVHYPIDPASVRAKLAELNDEPTKDSLAEHYGGAFDYRYEVVPLSEINIPEVWKPTKVPPLVVRMQAGKPLDPVRLGKDKYGYYVEDGIHRTNLSRQLGFTHVPAIVSEWNHTLKGFPPELPVPPMGTWVLLLEPFHAGDQIFQYGWLVEHVGYYDQYSTRRHLYTVARVNQHSQYPNYARMSDQDIIFAPEPSWGPMVKERTSPGAPEPLWGEQMAIRTSPAGG